MSISVSGLHIARCVTVVAFFLLLGGLAARAFPWPPWSSENTGNSAPSTTPENGDLFEGKVFVSDSSDGGFSFWFFNPGNSVKRGWVPLRYSLVIWTFRGHPKQAQTMGYDEGSEFSYELDTAAKTIKFREADGQVKSYKYQFANPNHVKLSQVETNFSLYAVPSQPEMFFRSKKFQATGMGMDPNSDEHANHRLAILNEFIAAAKNAEPFPDISDTPATPTPTPTSPIGGPPPPSSPSPSPTPPPAIINVTNVTVTNVVLENVADKEGGNSGEEKMDDQPSGDPSKQLTLDDLVNGQYKGSFVNELNETTREFELKIGSQTHPSGQPPSAAIFATLRFDDGRGDDGLQGVATYGQNTTLTLGWKNSTGSMTFDGKLEGDRLSGAWRLEGAKEETGRGTFEATRSGL